MIGFLKALSGSQYITEMLLACYLVALPHRKKAGFIFRAAAISTLAEMISLLVMNIPQVQVIWQNSTYVILSCGVHFVVFALLSGGFFWICCPVSRREKIYCAALCLCIQHVSSSFRLLAEGLLPWSGEFFSALVLLVSIVPAYYFFYICCLRQICEDGYYRVDVLQLTSATCLVFLVATLISVVVKTVDPTGNSTLFLTSQVYEMLCCIFLMWIQANQKKTLKLQRELDIQDYLQSLRREQFRQSKGDLALTTHLMHELKHQVAKMAAAEDGPEREALLDQIADNLQVYDEQFVTKSELLDTVLLERRLYCRANHIRWMCVVDGPRMDFMTTEDLYLIFRNALDNAIEGVVQLQDIHRRIIDLKVYIQNAFLMIQIENEFTGAVRFTDGLPLTTKEDRIHHGYGLKTIKQIAERYGGCVTVHAKNQRFSLQIMIPMNYC